MAKRGGGGMAGDEFDQELGLPEMSDALGDEGGSDIAELNDSALREETISRAVERLEDEYERRDELSIDRVNAVCDRIGLTVGETTFVRDEMRRLGLLAPRGASE